MAIENLKKKNMILTLLFLIYRFWLYKNIARKKNIKASVTFRHLGMNSLKRALLFHQAFFHFHTDPFLPPQLQQQQQLRYAKKKLKKLKDPLKQLLPSPLLLSWVSSKQSLSPPFHSIPFPFFSPHHPLQLHSEISSAGWFMLTHKA